MVSLVQSLTESIASVRRDLLVGVTDWCTHPADLDVERIRGTKNPNVRRIVELAPDLVVANKEENRRTDIEALRAAGVPVWVTVTESVPAALDSLHRLFAAVLRRPAPEWLAAADAVWRAGPPPARARVAIAVWRDPWMVVGADTFTGDLTARLGLANVFDDADGRYPHVDVATIEAARGPGPAARRAVRVHPERRPRGVPLHADETRERAAADLVRPLARERPPRTTCRATQTFGVTEYPRRRRGGEVTVRRMACRGLTDDRAVVSLGSAPIDRIAATRHGPWLLRVSEEPRPLRESDEVDVTRQRASHAVERRPSAAASGS